MTATGRIVTLGLTFGFLGAFALPVVLFIAFYALGSLFGPCGTPGDSGGCEMGLSMLALAAVPVGAVAGVILGILLGRRTRSAA